MIGQYLVISGGVGDATDGTSGHAYLGDTWALDTTAPTNWECLDDGAFAAALVWPKHIVATCFFVGKKLVTLQPNRSAFKKRSRSQHLCEQQHDAVAVQFLATLAQSGTVACVQFSCITFSAELALQCHATPSLCCVLVTWSACSAGRSGSRGCSCWR